MLDLALIIGLGVLFPIVHIANDWLFDFAEVSPQVALIYLPAFLRLMNVLVLGRLKGSAATILGGLLLINSFEDDLQTELLNVAASTTGPLIALFLFDQWRKRAVDLTSLADLAFVTVIYCLANAVLHHFVWILDDLEGAGSASELAFMVVGDLTGALLGAYLLKWAAQRLRLPRP